MSTSPQPPARLASEEVIINAPMSYAGSAQRIVRLRRRAHNTGLKIAITILVVVLVILVWVIVTAWYLLWGLWLVPYRILRRGARKRKAEALRHRELMGTIQGAAAASAAAIVTSTTAEAVRPDVDAGDQSHVRVDDAERDRAVAALNAHYMAGRLTHEELDERVAQAHAARTRGELTGLLFDLPALPAGEPGGSSAV
jgi:hypothetical protein